MYKAYYSFTAPSKSLPDHSSTASLASPLLNVALEINVNDAASNQDARVTTYY
jgi:hypothetical protein